MKWIISSDPNINSAFRWGMIYGLFLGWALWCH